MSRTLQLTEQLISRPSVTPEDAGCLDLIASRLTPLGFACERMDSGPDNFRVSNLWAMKRSTHAKAKTLVFAGTRMWCPLAPWTNGRKTRSRPPTAMACCMAEAAAT